MTRNFLLLDDSPCMRKILRRKILANLNDTQVFEASDSQQALQILAEKPCHLIVYSWHITDCGALPFLRMLRNDPKLSEIPVLLLSSDREERPAAALLKAGASECLYLPASTRALTEAINRVCNPISLRKNKRYNLSMATAVLEQKRLRLTAEIINISLGGMLCELEWSDELQCGAPLMARVEVDLEGGMRSAGSLHAKIVNLRMTESNPDHTFSRVRLALAFIHVPSEARESLEAIFEIADSEDEEQNVA